MEESIITTYKLGDVCHYNQGHNFSKNKPEYFNDKIVNYFRVKDLKHAETVFNSELTLSSLGLSIIKKYKIIFKKGTIILSKEGTIGKVSILGNDSFTSSHILNILPNNKIKNKYLYYWLIKNRKKIENKATGSVIKYLSYINLMKEKILLPDLQEQTEIVAIIEIIEKQINNVYNIIQSIEKRAILMQKLYDSNFLISDITTKYKKGYPYKRTDFQETGKYKVFTIKNIKNETKFSYTNVIKNNILQSGDVVTGLDGTIGTTKIISSLGWISSSMILSITSQYFLEIWASIKINGQKLIKQTTGSVIKHIHLTKILNLKTSIQGYDEKISQLYLKALELVKNLENLKTLAIKLLIKN